MKAYSYAVYGLMAGLTAGVGLTTLGVSQSVGIPVAIVVQLAVTGSCFFPPWIRHVRSEETQQ